jgi:hypothetical protein
VATIQQVVEQIVELIHDVASGRKQTSCEARCGQRTALAPSLRESRTGSYVWDHGPELRVSPDAFSSGDVGSYFGEGRSGFHVVRYAAILLPAFLVPGRADLARLAIADDFELACRYTGIDQGRTNSFGAFDAKCQVEAHRPTRVGPSADDDLDRRMGDQILGSVDDSGKGIWPDPGAVHIKVCVLHVFVELFFVLFDGHVRVRRSRWNLYRDDPEYRYAVPAG